jgi:CRP-like cAMP-binding protein
VVLGDDVSLHQAVVVASGLAFRASAAALFAEFGRGGALQHALLRYTRVLIGQLSQTALCNRLHAAEQRLGRWLLMCHDRVGSNHLCMTQELIAQMLGGRRESVTVAAGKLQDRGLIRYCRGHITILDRPGLERSVCECYALMDPVLSRAARC